MEPIREEEVSGEEPSVDFDDAFEQWERDQTESTEIEYTESDSSHDVVLEMVMQNSWRRSGSGRLMKGSLTNIVEDTEVEPDALVCGPPELPPAWRSALRRTYRYFFKRYAAIKWMGILLTIYGAIMTFSERGALGSVGGFVDPDEGFIIDPESDERTSDGVILMSDGETLRSTVAETPFQMYMMGIARLSAFFMYPMLVLVFFSKFRATMQFVSQSRFSMFFYEDLHELHVYCGWMCLIGGIVHTVTHLARWAEQGNLYLLFDHFSGISGFVVMTAVLVGAGPMIWLRQKINFEIRMALHYMMAVVFCLGMAFHAPTIIAPNGGFSTYVFSIILVWYLLDFLYVAFMMTERIESTVFHVVPTGVQLTMKVSDRFQNSGGHGGYCYVNFPWISRVEWHAYSLFENPVNPGERQIYIQNAGDWTNKVHTALARDTSRPVWVQGPFSSPYDHASAYDNQILVAGGIGITPAISVMRVHKETRRSNLVWAVRDPHMLEFFIKHGEFSEKGWNLIFYTGKEPLLFVGSDDEYITANGARLHIIRARPNFDVVLPNLIYSIESGTCVPEAYTPNAKLDAVAAMKMKLADLESAGETYTNEEKLDIIGEVAEDHGFLFTDLATDLCGEEAATLLRASAVMREKRQELRSSNVLAALRRFESERVLSDADDLMPLLPAHRRRGLNKQNSVPQGLGPTRTTLSSTPKFDSRRAMLKKQLSVNTKAWNAVAESSTDWSTEDSNAFKPHKKNELDTRDYVKGLDKEKVLSTWGVLYCGGKSPLATAMQKAAKDYGINTHVESFAW